MRETGSCIRCRRVDALLPNESGVSYTPPPQVAGFRPCPACVCSLSVMIDP
jgi:hypothetical protein